MAVLTLLARRLALAALLVVVMLHAAQAQNKPPPTMGPSGLPLPRFASLASATVNVRTGPSTDHPIRWTYARSGLPVRIVEEFDVWRRIEDPDGETGWAHSSLLSVRRTVMVQGDGPQELRRSAEPEARLVARVEPGAIGEFQGCERDWCRIEIGGQRGWMQRGQLWGVGGSD